MTKRGIANTDVAKAQQGWKSQYDEFSYWIDQVEGELPLDLEGTLFRNGPGLNDVYGTPLVHPIDGDGMVTAISFSKGHAHFRSSFVKTKEFLAEKKAKAMIYEGYMGSSPLSRVTRTWMVLKSALFGKIPRFQYKKPANTNVFYWGGKVLALYEMGLPYRLDPHTLETIGPDDLNGVLECRTFAAHFRYDYMKDVMVCMSVAPKLVGPSSLYIYEFDREWNVVQQQHHQLEGFYYSHDFMITDNYYVFHQTPFVNLDKKLLFQYAIGLKSPGDGMKHYENLPSRMLVIPRDMSKMSNVRWFDTEPCHIYHFGQCWENKDGVSFSACALPPGFNMEFDSKIWLSNASVAPGRMYKYQISFTDNKCVREFADRSSCEFPFIHPDRSGMYCRYAYLMAHDHDTEGLPFDDIVKWDWEGKNRQVTHFENGVIGEPIYAPRVGSTCEDDGYVMTQVYNTKIGKTQIAIMDAAKMNDGPVALLTLRHHTPYGFHGTWCKEVFTRPTNGKL